MSEALIELQKPHVDIGLVTGDPDRARRFYSEVLELPELPSRALAPDITQYRFLFGEQELKLTSYPNLPAREPAGIYDGLGYRVLALFIDDLDALAERIEAFGGRLAEGADLPGNLRIRFAKDADGNMLELIGLPTPAGESLGSRIQIGLTVSDVEASRRFYGEILGLPEHPSMPISKGITRHAFGGGETTLKFWSTGKEIPSFAGAPSRAIGIRYVTFLVHELDRLARELEARGVPIVMPVTEIRKAAKIMFACDPDGNWIEFGQLL